MLGQHNSINDLLSTDELAEYTSVEYPLNLSILHKALKLKLRAEPGYEVWVPFIYFRSVQFLRDKSKAIKVTPHKVFISNLGRVCSLRGKEPKLLNVVYGEHPYPRITIDKSNFRLHRALACSFISLDRFLLANESATSAHPKDLQVNHIDTIKTNFSLDNLEWVTSLGNIKHAVDAGLMVNGIDDSQTKPVKGRILEGSFKGHEFLLYGNAECWEYGFQQPNISACCNGRGKSHKKCQWSFATESDVAVLPRGLTPEILVSLNL